MTLGPVWLGHERGDRRMRLSLVRIAFRSALLISYSQRTGSLTVPHSASVRLSAGRGSRRQVQRWNLVLTRRSPQRGRVLARCLCVRFTHLRDTPPRDTFRERRLERSHCGHFRPVMQVDRTRRSPNAPSTTPGVMEAAAVSTVRCSLWP